MPFVTCDGSNIFVDTAGDGTPVLFLHGFSLDHRQWNPQWSDFSRGHQAFRIDLRAHGSSAASQHGYTHAAMARDVQRLLVQIGMDRLNPGWIVAHSLSADAALQTALAEPRALRGVVVAMPSVWGHRWSDEVEELSNAMRRAARAGDVAGALERYRADAAFDGIRDHPAIMAAVLEMQSRYKGAHLSNDEPAAGPPTLERLNGCKVPVLVLSGELDRADFRDCAAEIVAAVPGAVQREIAGAHHFANLEKPAEFTSEVLEFLSHGP